MWDRSEDLRTDQDVIDCLNAVLEETDDVRVLQEALGDVARARGMAEIAREAGVGRESLYKSLSRDGNPSLQTTVKVIEALGGRLSVVPA